MVKNAYGVCPGAIRANPNATGDMRSAPSLAAMIQRKSYAGLPITARMTSPILNTTRV